VFPCPKLFTKENIYDIILCVLLFGRTHLNIILFYEEKK